MAENYSLLEFVRQLSSDDGLRTDFATDPHGVLADHGLDGLGAEDVHDALLLVDDTRTVEFTGEHVDPGPTFDPGADLARTFADYAGIAGAHVGFEVDRAGDIDDLDGYPAPTHHAAATHDEHAGDPHPGDGFGHGSDRGLDAGLDHQEQSGTDDGDLHQPSVALPGAADHVQDAAFDETGTYDEFGDAPAFDHPHGYDHPADEPGHPH